MVIHIRYCRRCKKANENRKRFLKKYSEKYGKKYIISTKKWVGTLLCPNCDKKGRAYILKKENSSSGHILYFYYVQHSKGDKRGGNSLYVGVCYIGKCDEQGNLLNLSLKSK